MNSVWDQFEAKVEDLFNDGYNLPVPLHVIAISKIELKVSSWKRLSTNETRQKDLTRDSVAEDFPCVKSETIELHDDNQNTNQCDIAEDVDTPIKTGGIQKCIRKLQQGSSSNSQKVSDNKSEIYETFNPPISRPRRQTPSRYRRDPHVMPITFGEQRNPAESPSAHHNDSPTILHKLPNRRQRLLSASNSDNLDRQKSMQSDTGYVEKKPWEKTKRKKQKVQVEQGKVINVSPTCCSSGFDAKIDVDTSTETVYPNGDSPCIDTSKTKNGCESRTRSPSVGIESPSTGDPETGCPPASCSIDDGDAVEVDIPSADSRTDAKILREKNLTSANVPVAESEREGTTKKRGRPRKTAVEISNVKISEKSCRQDTPRKRGRPRKKTQESHLKETATNGEFEIVNPEIKQEKSESVVTLLEGMTQQSAVKTNQIDATSESTTISNEQQQGTKRQTKRNSRNVNSNNQCVRKARRKKEIESKASIEILTEKAMKGASTVKKGPDSQKGSHVCSKCGSKFKNKQSLQLHEEFHRNGYLQCPHCPSKFKNRYTYAIHQNIHDGKVFSCDQCSYSCGSASHLKTHQVRVHERLKKHLCDICGEGFTTVTVLKTHRDNKHFRESLRDRHQCTECDYKTHSTHSFKYHMKMKHGSVSLRHICNVCGLLFKYKNSLTVHLKRHFSEKPYTCSMCDFRAVCKADVRNHVSRIHTERLYTCSTCGKTFKQKSHLSRHEVIHTGEKNFACPDCSYRCNVKGNLVHHCLQVHSRDIRVMSKIIKTDLDDSGCKEAKAEPDDSMATADQLNDVKMPVPVDKTNSSTDCVISPSDVNNAVRRPKHRQKVKIGVTENPCAVVTHSLETTQKYQLNSATTTATTSDIIEILDPSTGTNQIMFLKQEESAETFMSEQETSANVITVQDGENQYKVICGNNVDINDLQLGGIHDMISLINDQQMQRPVEVISAPTQTTGEGATELLVLSERASIAEQPDMDVMTFDNIAAEENVETSDV